MPDIDPAKSGEITRLLDRWTGGDIEALRQIAKLLYPEWRVMAGGYFRGERTGHTLQPTALINEAYMLLSKLRPRGFDNRREFQGLVAQLMRQILVDHARRVKAAKRGGDAEVVADANPPASEVMSAEQFLTLHNALDELAARNERKARVIELRYFGGFSQEEVGEALGISVATVHREQRMAEAWLNRALQREVFV